MAISSWVIWAWYGSSLLLPRFLKEIHAILLELLTEQVNRHKIDLKKVDIFALGVTAYELIEGVKLETRGPSWSDLRSNCIHFSPITRQSFSGDLLATVTQMMSENPQDRPCVDALLS